MITLISKSLTGGDNVIRRYVVALEGTDGDPDKVIRRIRSRISVSALISYQ